MLFSAFAAQAAHANTNATSWDCQHFEEEKTQFQESRCTSNSSFGHWEKVQTSAGVKREITGESEGNTVLKATTGGVAVELTSTALDAEAAGVGEPAFVENREVGGVMESWGEGKIKYTNVTANHSCLVNGAASATIITERLKAHTLSTTELKFEPAAGSTFASFTLSSCAISALNKTWTISGSVVGTVNGDKTVFTHEGTTGQGTLKANTSIPAGIAGVLLIEDATGGSLSLA